MDRIELPWPPRELSPNSRKDRRHTGDKRKAYKTACWTVAKAGKFRASHLDITFHPPDGRKRDLDNMLGSIKYGLDGIALAMGVDDSEWSITIRKGDPCRPNGKVIVRNYWRSCWRWLDELIFLLGLTLNTSNL